MFRHLAHRHAPRIAHHIARLHRFAIGGAWFFIVVSMLHLLYAISVKWNESAGVFKAYHTVVNDISYDAFGLTYAGTLGLLLALGQFGVVGVAALTGCKGIVHIPILGRLNRFWGIGHLILISWAALWLGNFIWLASIDHAFDSYGQVFIMSILFICTSWRGLADWKQHRQHNHLPADQPPKPPHRSTRTTAEHEVVKLLRTQEVSVSPRIRELSDRAAADLDSTPHDPNAVFSIPERLQRIYILARKKMVPTRIFTAKTASQTSRKLTELARSSRSQFKKLAGRWKSSTPDAA